MLQLQLQLLWQSEKCGHQQIINCEAKNKLMIGSHTGLGGESVDRSRARLVPAQDGTHPFAKRQLAVVPSTLLHIPSILSHWASFTSSFFFFLNLFVFVFGNWQEFVSCFEISPTVSCWGLLFGLSSVSLLTIITASLVKRAEKSKLTLKVHYTWINPETEYHMLGWSYPCVLSRLTNVDGCWFG